MNFKLVARNPAAADGKSHRRQKQRTKARLLNQQSEIIKIPQCFVEATMAQSLRWY